MAGMLKQNWDFPREELRENVRIRAVLFGDGHVDCP